MASAVTLDPWTIPMSLPPDGVDSNFDDPPSQAWIPRVTCYICLPIGILVILLRLATRLRFGHGLGSDDYTCLAAGVAFIWYCSLLLVAVADDRYGRHSWDLPVALMTERFLKLAIASAVANLTANALFKTSILLLLRRIFSAAYWSNILIWIGIIVNNVLYAVLIAVWVAHSVPRPGDGGWLSLEFSSRSSVDMSIVLVAASAFGCLTDFYVLLIPIGAVASLKMSGKKKVAVCALFIAGLFACALSLARLAIQVQYNYSATEVRDPIWPAMPANALGVSEVTLGIICACMPVCVPSFRIMKRQTSIAWSSIKGTLLKSRQTSASQSHGSRLPTSSQRLPDIPRGTLGSVTTMFTRKPESGEFAADRPYSELRTADMDYHKHVA